jgi:hypothetical protein
LTAFIMVTFAHMLKDRSGLLVASTDMAHALLCTVGDTETPLDRNVVTVFVFALLSGRSMGTAQASLFDLLGASWVSTLLSLGTMSDTEPPLNHSVDTVFDFAISSSALLGRGIFLVATFY